MSSPVIDTEDGQNETQWRPFAPVLWVYYQGYDPVRSLTEVRDALALEPAWGQVFGTGEMKIGEHRVAYVVGDTMSSQKYLIKHGVNVYGLLPASLTSGNLDIASKIIVSLEFEVEAVLSDLDEYDLVTVYPSSNVAQCRL